MERRPIGNRDCLFTESARRQSIRRSGNPPSQLSVSPTMYRVRDSVPVSQDFRVLCADRAVERTTGRLHVPRRPEGSPVWNFKRGCREGHCHRKRHYCLHQQCAGSAGYGQHIRNRKSRHGILPSGSFRPEQGLWFLEFFSLGRTGPPYCTRLSPETAQSTRGPRSSVAGTTLRLPAAPKWAYARRGNAMSVSTS